MRKTIFFLFVVVCLFTTANNISAANSLKGSIKNTKNEPVTGASVYFPELKTGAVTDVNGYYEINNLPAKTLLVQIISLGYKSITEPLALNHLSQKDFTLEETVVEINEIAVTGQANAIKQSKTPSPVSVVSHDEIMQKSSTNIIDALAQQPGVSQITTGSGISKPVIRGLGYNRVIVLNDGVRQEGQQWGDEHGIEIDGNDVGKVEILKGPASLMYGSDAMAGVINFLPSPILPQGVKKLELMANYQTNNGLSALSADYAGHINSFVWSARYSIKAAHDYKNSYDGYVFNSGFKENAASALLGINKSWGYSHLTLSTYNLTPGMVEGERDSLTGKFLKQVVDNGEVSDAIADKTDFLSYNKQVPYQKVNHLKAVWSNNIIVGDGFLKSVFGFQQNNRKEFEDALAPDVEALFFKQNTYNYDVHYQFPEKNKLNVTVGVNGMYQHSMNLGEEFLIPEFQLFDAGGFFVFNKDFGKLDLTGGLRFDNRSLTTKALYLNADEEVTNAGAVDAVQKFAALDKNFNGVSGSLGLAWELNDKWNMKFNLSRGYRAPNVSELSSNGVHEGTLRYETGNSQLKSENSLQVDYEVAFVNEHISARLNLFSNTIDNFIFSRKLTGAGGTDSIADDVPVFQFYQDKAVLTGGEFTLDIHPHPLDWLHFENSISYVNAQFVNQPDSMKYLPFTPAPKWNSDLRAEINMHSKLLNNSYCSLGFEYNFAQNHVFSAYNTETATPGYFLLNASLGTDVIVGKQKFSVYLNGDNLTDVAYQNHLSRLKYAPENYATGRTGVYNMGRNVSVKVVVPVML
jgi:iron complex outermembrane recepter protein